MFKLPGKGLANSVPASLGPVAFMERRGQGYLHNTSEKQPCHVFGAATLYKCVCDLLLLHKPRAVPPVPDRSCVPLVKHKHKQSLRMIGLILWCVLLPFGKIHDDIGCLNSNRTSAGRMTRTLVRGWCSLGCRASAVSWYTRGRGISVAVFNDCYCTLRSYHSRS